MAKDIKLRWLAVYDIITLPLVISYFFSSKMITDFINDHNLNILFAIFLLITISSYILLAIFGFWKILHHIFKKQEIFSKKPGVVRIVLYTLLIWAFIFLFAIMPPPSSRSKARDARRMADMRQLAAAQDMYFLENNRFMPSENMPLAIGSFLDPVPSDPGGGEIVLCSQPNPAFIYCAIDNTNNPSNFCYYTRLENKYIIKTGQEVAYYTATHAGNFKRATPPKTLDECAEGD